MNRGDRREIARNVLLPAAALMLALGLARPMGVRAQESDALAVAHTYLAAMNRHDTGDALALFATDANVDDDGRQFQGTEDVRRWLQEQVNQDVSIHLRSGPSGSGDSVTWVGMISFEDGGPVRAQTWLSTTLALQAGKITSLSTRDAAWPSSVPETSPAFRPLPPVPAQVPHLQGPPALPRETLGVTMPRDPTDLTAPLLVGGLGAAAYLVLLTRRCADRR